jgi:fatty acid omega-hydroxylase
MRFAVHGFGANCVQLAMMACGCGRTPIDFQDLFLRYTFDNICMVGFGVDPGCLAPGLPVVPFAQAFDIATEGTLTRMVVPEIFWRTTRALGWGMEAKMAKAIQVLDKFAMNVISERRKELTLLKSQQGSSSSSDYPCDLLSRFMQMDDQNGNAYTDKFLRDVTTNFVLAGRDTTAVALSWFFWLITQHPEVEDKILQEIQTTLQSRVKEDDSSAFNFEELKQLNYLHAALSESMRLYPSVPIDNKDVTANDVLPDGTFVRKGTRLMYSIYSMGRMESIWGKDCLEYRPERWLRNGVFVPESPFKYTVFNAGPRLCLGKELAYLQMKSVASAILRNYHVQLVPGHKVEYKLSLTLIMKHGLRVTLHPRVTVQHRHLSTK